MTSAIPSDPIKRLAVLRTMSTTSSVLPARERVSTAPSKSALGVRLENGRSSSVMYVDDLEKRFSTARNSPSPIDLPHCFQKGLTTPTLAFGDQFLCAKMYTSTIKTRCPGGN